jgi:lipopolysaccharide transport system ATP-binding protein
MPPMSRLQNEPDLILDVQHVWKIYCRHLKKALWYGLKDLAREVTGTSKPRVQGELRPGEFFSVRDAHFQVRRGECVAMIGPNGAGKSTMLKMINGLIKPNAGRIDIRGKIGALIELGTGFNPILSGRENVYINGSVLGMKKRETDELFDEIVDFAELAHVIDDPIKTYSSGMRVRLGFAVAATLRPELLLIDEVLAVGDVGFRMKCFAHLRKLIENGVAVILVTHATGMLPRLATRSVVFDSGNIVHDGDLEKGCTIYEELLGVNERKREEQQETGKSIGRVELAETINDTGSPQREFQTGDTLRLRIKLTVEQPIADARLVVALCSPVLGSISSVATPFQNVKFDVLPPGRELVLEYPQIPLMIGSFHFNISLYGPEITDFYHRASGRAMFRIVGPPVDANGYGINGLARLEHRWKLDSPTS